MQPCSLYECVYVSAQGIPAGGTLNDATSTHTHAQARTHAHTQESACQEIIMISMSAGDEGGSKRGEMDTQYWMPFQSAEDQCDYIFKSHVEHAAARNLI